MILLSFSNSQKKKKAFFPTQCANRLDVFKGSVQCERAEFATYVIYKYEL